MDGQLTIDELYVRKIDRDQGEHLARRARDKHPESVALQLAWEVAKKEADLAHTTYLDGLIHEQAALAAV